MNGFDVARSRPPLEQPPAIVSATAFDRFPTEAFDVDAIGCLLKPGTPERLQCAAEPSGQRHQLHMRTSVDTRPISPHRGVRFAPDFASAGSSP